MCKDFVNKFEGCFTLNTTCHVEGEAGVVFAFKVCLCKGEAVEKFTVFSKVKLRNIPIFSKGILQNIPIFLNDIFKQVNYADFCILVGYAVCIEIAVKHNTCKSAEKAKVLTARYCFHKPLHIVFAYFIAGKIFKEVNHTNLCVGVCDAMFRHISVKQALCH